MTECWMSRGAAVVVFGFSECMEGKLTYIGEKGSMLEYENLGKTIWLRNSEVWEFKN